MSLLHQLMAAEHQRELQRLGRELRRGRPESAGRRGRRRARGPGAAGARAGEAAAEPLLAGAAPPRC